MSYRSPWMTEEIELFRNSFRRHLASELAPKAERWCAQKMIDRDAWRALGELGALCPQVPEDYNGPGGTFAHVAAVIEDLEAILPEMTIGVTVQNAIVGQYVLAYATDEQKKRWLPGMMNGTLVTAIAMTEPNAGSDLQSLQTRARRSGDAFLLNGQKTLITNGQLADLILVAAKTEQARDARGISLFMVEAQATEGFRRGRNLDKIGLHASDTSELFFADAVVPNENLLGGRDGLGFAQMMEQLPKERLGLAIQAVAATERIVDITVAYTKERTAFGQPLIEFQNTAFALAERKSEALIARVFIDWCIGRAVAGDLDQVTAAMAKWWTTAKQFATADACLQLHGGYGYLREYEIARRFVDARIQTIYGGANEIMKLLIAQTL